MAGTLTISTLSDGTNSTSSTNCIQGSAKAWVRWGYPSGGPVAITKSYNISSVVRASSGNYSMNFTNALADGNYSMVGAFSCAQGSGVNTGAVQIFNNGSSLTAPTASTFYVNIPNYNATANVDPLYACFVVFD